MPGGFNRRRKLRDFDAVRERIRMEVKNDPTTAYIIDNNEEAFCRAFDCAREQMFREASPSHRAEDLSARLKSKEAIPSRPQPVNAPEDEDGADPHQQRLIDDVVKTAEDNTAQGQERHMEAVARLLDARELTNTEGGSGDGDE